MMKLALFLTSLALTLATVPPVPAFLWAGSDSLLTQGTTSGAISSGSLSAYARSVIGNGETPVALSNFVSATQTPDVLLVFVQPELKTSQLSELSGAFQPRSEGGVFANLKMFVEKSPVSVTLPRVFADSESLVEGLSALENVHMVDAAAAEGFLAENKDIFGNNRCDVVVVQFAPASGSLADKLRADDALMASVVRVVADKSTENYVAMFTATSSGSSAHAQALEMAQQENVQVKSNARLYSKAQQKEDGDGNANNNNDVLYMTPGILSGLLISLLLFLISLCGVGGLMALQTPDQWEKEGGALAGQ